MSRKEKGVKNMYLKILKKSFKNKKSINFILLIFITLATLFIAGSINNMLIIINGMDNFIEKAELADFYVVSAIHEKQDAEAIDDKNVLDFLDNNEHVDEYYADKILFAANTNLIIKDDESLATNGGTCIINHINIHKQKFFDEDNNIITDIEDGTLYVKRGILLSNDLKVGDYITIKTDNGYAKKFKIAGYCKDAFLGSEMMGVARVIVSENDFEEMCSETDLPFGKMYSIESNDVKSFKEDYHEQSINAMFDADQQLIKSTYVMNMVIAGVILLISMCLIVIAFVMLRFTIIFTINEEYKEIGIMKAIGLKEKSIRLLYVVKYFVISTVGVLLGFIGSIPFSKVLLNSVVAEMYIEINANNILINFIISLLVAVIVVLFAYSGTKKIKKFTPMDAIRNGNNGERFNKKGIFKLEKSHKKATTFLALNDVCSELKKYLVLFFATIIGVWLVVMPVNTINTLQSEEIAAWFGMPDCDYCISDEEIITELILDSSKQNYVDFLNEIEQRFVDNNIAVSNISTELMFRFKIRKGDKSYKSLSLQGIGTDTDMYFYDEGEPPILENEVALTHITAREIDAGIGDTVYVSFGEEERPFVVTALYQSMNNMGEGIRFTQDAELDYSFVSGVFAVQITFEKNVDKEKVEEILPEYKIETIKEYIDRMIGGISEQLVSVKILVLTLVIIINIMIVMLMQKMFLLREQGEMGMLKAIGFSNKDIIIWQTKRIMLVLFAGITIGVLTGTPFSQITSGQVFKFMGASKIEFVINPMEVYLIYPVALFVATVIGCVITMLKVRKISIQEMNNME